MNKKCGKCQIIKDLTCFGKLKKSKDGFNHLCKECKRTYDNNFHKNRNIKQRKRKLDLQKQRIKLIREFIITHLKNCECKICGEKRLPTLDFHHLNGKSFNVSDGIKNGFSINKIENEMKKCEILCSNCHRMETSKQFDWYKQ
jgi:hypothetical protein